MSHGWIQVLPIVPTEYTPQTVTSVIHTLAVCFHLLLHVTMQFLRMQLRICLHLLPKLVIKVWLHLVDWIPRCYDVLGVRE